MSRCVLLCVLLVFAVLMVPVSAADQPPGAIRWDVFNPTQPPPATKGPAPAVYNLSRPFSWPQDIEVDDDGCFYVLCHARQSITKYRPDGSFDKLWLEDTGHPCVGGTMDMAVLSGERIYLASDHWLPIIRRFGPDTNAIDDLEGVFPASCLTADEDGNYYILGKDTMRVFSAEGKLTSSWKACPAFSMAFGPDDGIYMYSNQTVAVYSKAGNLLRTIDLKSLPVGSSRMEIAVDDNGDIYLGYGGGFLRLDNAGRPLAHWRPYVSTSANRYFGTVVDVAVNNGLVYGLLRRVNAPPEVQAYTPDGQCIARYVFPKLEAELPWSVVPQADGRYAVHQAQRTWGQDCVLLYGPDGKLAGSIPDHDTGVADIEAAPGGGYYVARYSQIERVDEDGKNARVLNKEHRYLEVAVDPSTGNLFARSNKGQIHVLDPGGNILRTIDLREDLGLGRPSMSAGMNCFIALDGKGFIYISDTDNHRIVKVDMDGSYVSEFGREGSGIGELRRPKGLTIDSEGRVIVADTRNHRIQVFAPDGESLGVWGRLGTGDGELDRPHGISILPGRAVYIADTHNDRVVTAPYAEFWQAVSREIRPLPAYVPPVREVIPEPGDVTIEGIVTADSYDFTDCMYIQAADRSWGTKVTLPDGYTVRRNERIRVTGTLERKERATMHVMAKKIDYIASTQEAPGLLGMANLYVGDGYRQGNRRTDLSNLGLLVKTWGRVISVDTTTKFFVISDGSKLGKAAGLEVYAGQLKAPLTSWPKVGQYVTVTGISAVRPVGDGTYRSAIRLRCQDDLQVLVEN